jgi:HK97 family phage major capsid protein
MSDVGFALTQVRDQVKAKLDERAAIQARVTAAEAEVDAIISRANTERRDISDEETALIRERRDDVTKVNAELDQVISDLAGLQQREQLLSEHEQSKAASQAAAARWAGAADTPEQNASARVTREPRTYGRHSEARGVSFFKDVYSRFLFGDMGASQRLERHLQEARVEELAGYDGVEARDVGTGAFAGLTVPQYLTDLVAPLARAYRPTVEICNRHPLPDKGMSIVISRVTTGSATAAQATENAATQETDMDDTALTVNVRTYAGQQDVSRQAIERGTGVDSIVLDDLTRDYWTKVDAAVLNGAGTSGTHLGIRATTGIVSVAYTDTTPTVAELWPKFADFNQQIEAGAFMGVTHYIMHPRRFWWVASSVGTNVPFLHVQKVATNQAGNVGTASYGANDRNLIGVDVVTDGNMLTNIGAGTNQDDIVGVYAPELHFWDDGVQFLRAEQTAAGNLTIKFVLYGYSAFTAERYPATHGIITGTGLVTPTF